MLLLSALALAGPFPEANPGRPSFSDNASPTETGALEIEAGAAADPEGVGLNYVLKFGVHPDADLRVGFDHGVAPEAGLGAASLLAKYTFRHPDDRSFGTAIAPFATFDLSDSSPGYGLFLIGTLPAGRIQLDTNLLLEGRYTPERTLTLDVDPVATLGVQITDMFGAYVEGYAILPVSDMEQGVGAAAALGVGLGLRPNLVLDASCDVGLVGLPKWTAQLGFTYAGWVAPQDRPLKGPSPRPPSPR